MVAVPARHPLLAHKRIPLDELLRYVRFVTYTLPSEPGTSLRAAGFHFDGLTDGGEWSRPSRPRAAVAQPG